MSRPVLALLLASLVANAALIVVVARRTPAEHASAAAPARTADPRAGDAVSRAGAPGEPGPDAVLPPEVAAILNSRDPARLHALLLAAGVDDEIRTELVQSALWKSREADFKALGMDDEQDAAIWWKDAGGARRYDSPEQRVRNRALNALHKEIFAELQRITGNDPEAFDPEKNTWLARKYGGLPREKAEALHRIDRDYDELLGELNEESGSFTLPSDVEKRRLLEAEREKDLAALLTPEERRDWELRNSSTADTLRHRMTQLDASEEEYRKIFALQKAFDDEFDRSRDFDDPFAPSPSFDEEYWEKREAAEKKLEAGIRAIVGEERHALAARENDQDFTTARAAAERLGLPADTADRLVALRAPAAAESARIAADPALSVAEKKAALARLAADTRAEVGRTLGPEAAKAYFNRGAMRWIDPLENGRVITLDPDRSGDYDTRGLDDNDDSAPLPTRNEPLVPVIPISNY